MPIRWLSKPIWVGWHSMLELKDVVVAYGRVTALKGISLKVAQNELVTLLGSNGAGKSTAIKAICGLVPLKRGEIRLAGERLDGLPTDAIARRGIALSPEGRRVFPHMTVQENLEMGGFAVRERRRLKAQEERVYSLFPLLRERRRQRAGTLSGGEQQMLALGRALMAEPQFLLLDEPSLGLAPIMVQRIAAAVTQLKQEGIGILLVEQNANMALRIADRGYLLQNGEVMLAGQARELMADERVKEVYLGCYRQAVQ